MDIALTPDTLAPETPGRLAGRPLQDWNVAYGRVEGYFQALRVHNKFLLGQLVTRVLDSAMGRAPHEPERSATELAAEELDRVIIDWFGQVLGEPVERHDQKLSTRGRLALLLADMPGKWQDLFLRPPPWPEEFTSTMRAAYLRAGPDFQLSQMTPRPLDLGPIATLTRLSRKPYARLVALAVWAIFAILLIKFFLLTH